MTNPLYIEANPLHIDTIPLYIEANPLYIGSILKFDTIFQPFRIILYTTRTMFHPFFLFTSLLIIFGVGLLISENLRDAIATIVVIQSIFFAVLLIISMALQAIYLIQRQHSFCDANPSQCPEW